jgi:hypothetical protein
MARTTVTLDPDVEQLVQKRMRERGVSFKQALNDIVREGAQTRRERFKLRTVAMGRPKVNLDRALTLAGHLEDEALMRRMRRGS